MILLVESQYYLELTRIRLLRRHALYKHLRNTEAPSPYVNPGSLQLRDTVMIETNLIKLEKALMEEIHDLIEESAAPFCRAFCVALQQYLPIELRKMVYWYLLPPTTIEIKERHVNPCRGLQEVLDQHIPPPAQIVYTDHQVRDFEVIAYTKHCIPTHVSRTPESRWYPADVIHLAKPLYCDEATMLELLETWYELRSFHFKSAKLVPRFLETDVLGYGLPVRDLARRFQINLLIDSIDQLDVTAYSVLLESLADVRRGALINSPMITRFWYDEFSRLFNNDEEIDAQQVEKTLKVKLEKSVRLFRKLVDAGHRVMLTLNGTEQHVLVRAELEDDTWAKKVGDLYHVEVVVEKLYESDYDG